MTDAELAVRKQNTRHSRCQRRREWARGVVLWSALVCIGILAIPAGLCFLLISGIWRLADKLLLALSADGR